MSTIEMEISALEEKLRQAELGPDPQFFEDVLADDAVIVAEDGQPSLAKSKVVEAHRPGGAPKFTRVEMRNLRIVEHQNAAVVTCEGIYENAAGSVTLRFMRVWLRHNGRWQVIAGSVAVAR
jgi:hypothetical protein